ncbi:hypothetical protein SO802_006107 [Lithocarpus litseifolius]|uniref:Uncharacterized protein n=1 Tax=Lithocarpus litseifolius TaxID=425828 RepID=A0AAW2DLJ1_9ROSI
MWVAEKQYLRKGGVVCVLGFCPWASFARALPLDLPFFDKPHLLSGIAKERVVDVVLRSSELDTGLSPSDNPEVMKADTTTHRRIEKNGESAWTDLATALGQAHNVISADELKALASVPSHELVSCHIHKLMQVLEQSLRMTTDYLSTEEKVVMVNSRAKAAEVESSKLRKDLIEAMD